MRPSRLVASAAVFASILLFVTSNAGVDAQGVAAPCTTATAVCAEWVTLGGGPGRSMFYRTYPLDVANNRVTRALVMVHGTNRNADHYFDTAKAAAFLAGAIEDTIVISPRIVCGTDALAPNEVNWPCGGDSWKSGGMSPTHPALSSFDIVDEILRKLARKNVFPNMKSIVVAGHSAGGQFVNRYEMSNRVHETLGVAVSYVVANPSSYAWPDATRALPVDDAAPANAAAGWNVETVHTKFTFGTFDAGKAPTYNRWPTGLESRTGAYTAKQTDEQLKKQLVSRPTTYLLGQVDTLPLGGFDSSPAAMAQGATRRARGEAFARFVNETLGAKHAIMIVPECGHNDRCMYTTDTVFPIVFPRN